MQNPNQELERIAFAIHDMVENDDFADIQERLAAFDNINIYLNRFRTPFLAQTIGSETPVEFYEWLFQEKNPQVNFAGASGVTVLMMAAEKGRADLVQFFIERGANVNARTNPQEVTYVELPHPLDDSININFPLTPICYALLNTVDYETGRNIIIELKNRGAVVDDTVRRLYAIMKDYVPPEDVNAFHQAYEDVLLNGRGVMNGGKRTRKQRKTKKRSIRRRSKTRRHRRNHH